MVHHPEGEDVKDDRRYRGLARPKPKAEVCEKMCEKCPFRPDGSGYAQDFLPDIKAAVEQIGAPFYCHDTALLDPRTTIDDDGKPSPVPQPHFKQCRGAWEAQMIAWEKRADEALAKKKKKKTP
jgi:hypothetical protein